MVTVKPKSSARVATVRAKLQAIANEGTNTMPATTEVPTNVTPIATVKRGRKPKTPIVQTADPVVVANVVTEIPTVDEVPTTVKRGRGRPKGSTNAAKASAPNTDVRAASKVSKVQTKAIDAVMHDAAQKSRDDHKNAPEKARQTAKAKATAKATIQTIAPLDYASAVQSSKFPTASNVRPLYIQRMPRVLDKNNQPTNQIDTSDLTASELDRLVDGEYLFPDNETIAEWSKAARLLIGGKPFAFFASLKNTDEDKAKKSVFYSVGYGVHALPVFAIIPYTRKSTASKPNAKNAVGNAIPVWFANASTFTKSRANSRIVKVTANTLSVAMVAPCAEGLTDGATPDGYKRSMPLVNGADGMAFLYDSLRANTVAARMGVILDAMAVFMRRRAESDSDYNDRINDIGMAGYVAPKASTAVAKPRDVDVMAEARRTMAEALSL